MGNYSMTPKEGDAMERESDFSEFEQFFKNFNDAHKDFDAFLRDFLLEQGLRVIAKTKPRTPVDTGALRNMWSIGEVRAAGQNLEVDLINSQEYASFMEYGHRLVNGAWQDGRFMLTISMDEVQRQMPARFDKAFKQYLQSKNAT